MNYKLEKEIRLVYPEIPVGRATNEIDNRYGRLTIKYRTKNKAGKTCWVAVCDCGMWTTVRKEQLTSKNSSKRSCGCLKNEYGFTNTSFKPVDITGQVFNGLVAIRCLNIKNHNRELLWECKDKNGKIVIKSEHELMKKWY